MACTCDNLTPEQELISNLQNVCPCCKDSTGNPFGIVDNPFGIITIEGEQGDSIPGPVGSRGASGQDATGTDGVSGIDGRNGFVYNIAVDTDGERNVLRVINAVGEPLTTPLGMEITTF